MYFKFEGSQQAINVPFIHDFNMIIDLKYDDAVLSSNDVTIGKNYELRCNKTFRYFLKIMKEPGCYSNT